MMSARLSRDLAIAAFSFFVISCTSSRPGDGEVKRTIQAHTEIVEPTTITDHVEVPGTIRAKTQTVLSSKVTGQITILRIREGDRVRQGDLLAEIEGRDASAQFRRAQAAKSEANRSLEEVDGAIRALEAAVRTAEANRDLAQATRQRYDVLRQRHSVSEQEFDETDTRYKAALSETDRARQTLNSTQARRLQVLARIEQAEAEVEAANIALGYLKITSPIDGIVVARQAEPGMLATPGMPLLAIDDDRTYQLLSVVEESRVGAIRAGQEITVQIDGASKTVAGRVGEIVPASDPATRTYTVKVDLTLPPETRRLIHSGFFGRAFVPAGDRQALLVPDTALIQRGQLTGVYVVRDHTAAFRLVRAGKRYDKGTEILSGLNSGTEILTAPAAGVSDGVKIVADSEGSAP